MPRLAKYARALAQYGHQEVAYIFTSGRVCAIAGAATAMESSTAARKLFMPSGYTFYRRAAKELQARQAGVEAALAHQLGVRSLGDDRAALEHDDAVGVLDGS